MAKGRVETLLTGQRSDDLCAENTCLESLRSGGETEAQRSLSQQFRLRQHSRLGAPSSCLGLGCLGGKLPHSACAGGGGGHLYSPFLPSGTVLDDIKHLGCLPLEQCHCTHGGHTYAPGESFNTSCSSW